MSTVEAATTSTNSFGVTDAVLFSLVIIATVGAGLFQVQNRTGRVQDGALV